MPSTLDPKPLPELHMQCRITESHPTTSDNDESSRVQGFKVQPFVESANPSPKPLKHTNYNDPHPRDPSFWNSEVQRCPYRSSSSCPCNAYLIRVRVHSASGTVISNVLLPWLLFRCPQVPVGEEEDIYLGPAAWLRNRLVVGTEILSQNT